MKKLISGVPDYLVSIGVKTANKKMFLIIVLNLLFLCPLLVAKNNLFIETSFIGEEKLLDKQSKYIETTYYSQFFSGNIDRNVLMFDTLNINIPNYRTITFIKSNDFSDAGKWIGNSTDGTGNFIFIYGNEGFKGTIAFEDKTYQITSLDSNNCVLIELNHSLFPPEVCSHSEELEHNHSTINTKKTEEFQSGSCNLRVLVAYTNAVNSNVSDVISLVKLAVEETNQSYRNSAINHELELAGIIKVNYVESGNYNNDKDRFYGKTDGFMDEIHSYRELLSADVCVLLFNDPSLCGIAKGINVNSTEAFCLVHYSCATGNYSFGHEIGHLQGARHDVYVDPSPTPYAYGHGYVSPNNNWRTIMAYSNACGGCIRLQYWSNPNISYGGLAMGNVATANNARVLNEQTDRVKKFVVPPTDINYSKNVQSKEIHNVIAKNKITCTNIVENSGELNLSSSGSIILNPGFKINEGGKLTINVGVNICDY